MSAAEPVPAAVLVPLYIDKDGERFAVFTKRRADLRRHAGEISFPGGRQDPQDASPRATALREAEEEIGLPGDQVTVLGTLPPTSTLATNYLILPFVGLIDAPRPWRISLLEVDEVLELPLSRLQASRTRTTLTRRGISFQTDVFLLDDQLIWGATARILENLFSELGALLDRASGG